MGGRRLRNLLAKAIHPQGGSLEPGAVPSPGGTRSSYTRSGLARPGCGRRLKQVLRLPGSGDPAQTLTPSASGRGPRHARPGQGAGSLRPSLSSAILSARGKGGRGLPHPKQTSLQCPRPSPLEDSGLRGRARRQPQPPEGCRLRNLPASPPLNCNNALGIPWASLAGRLARSRMSGWWAVSGSPLSPPRERALTHTHEAQDPGLQRLGWPKKPKTGGDRASARTAAPRLCVSSYETPAGASANRARDPRRESSAAHTTTSN